MGAQTIAFGAQKIAEMVTGKINGSHATGLNYVLFNGYIAELHEGERVLTAKESKSMNKGFGDVIISKFADQIVIREEADIQKIAKAFVYELNNVSFNMG